MGRTRRLPLVGREVELGEIEEALGAGRSVVVSGVPGVGKTRLAREALARAAAQGATTTWAMASQAARSIPLGALAGLVPRDALDGATKPEALLGAIVAGLPDGGDARVVVGVDDAHLLDDASAVLVRLLVDRPGVAVVLTLRPGERAPDAIGGLSRGSVADRIDVQELTEPDVARLLTDVLGGPVDRATVRRLWSTTRGNPLFLGELLHALLLAGSLAEQEGWWRWSGGFPRDTTMGALIAERTGHLDEEQRAALEIVAFGEPLALHLAEQLVGAPTIARLERDGLVDVTAIGAGERIRTAHPLYGEVVRAVTPVSRARAVRRELAAAIGARPDREPAEAVQAALWQLDGGAEVDPELLVLAARQAWVAGDPTLAERLARAAVRTPAGAEGRYLLGEALADLGRFDEAIAEWSALDEDAPADVRVRVACSQAQITALVLHQVDAAVASLDRTAATIDSPELERDLLAVRAVLLGQPITNAGAAAPAAPAAPPEEPRSPENEVWTLLATLPADLIAGRIAQVVPQLPRARGAAESASATMPNATLWVGLIVFFADLYQGRLDEAEGLARDRLDASLGAQQPLARATWTGALGVVAMQRGQASTAVALLEEAAALHADYPNGMRQGALFALAYARALGGDARGAAEALSAAEAEELGAFIEPVERGRARVWCRVAAGETSAATDLALEAAAGARTRGHAMHELALLHDAARLGAARRAHDRVVRLTAEMDGPWVDAVARHVAGLARGDQQLLEAAASAFESQGALIEACEAWHAAARTALARGRTTTAQASGRRAEALRAVLAAAGTTGLPVSGWDDPLTAREREVATLAARGLADKEVAARLGISLRTVHAHLRSIYAKLDIDGRGDLAVVFREPPPR